MTLQKKEKLWLYPPNMQSESSHKKLKGNLRFHLASTHLHSFKIQSVLECYPHAETERGKAACQ